ncbi:MAG: Fe-S cluster assembly protein SufD [Candidatus Muproteobacteria bacterium RBG_16_64_11]|uniref:Fe-S cluster assembly protein SufD n=1 Tax=Candidatus Muproteobacteria bacterium RBG_16_64_11 TaxID=1817758 RepID=A0A1F6TAW9_9PROT|nr:MAG: Fe-S cluster assembly protein SufD [Candidatus Muproteobacteria bacterium RBG_16_64_11]
MNAHSMRKTNYFDGLVQARDQANGPDWLMALRAAARARTDTLALPGARDEDWRFTDIAPLRKLSFHYPPPAHALTTADIQAFLLPEAPTRLVFVNGSYAPQLSSLDRPPAGVAVTALRQASAGHAALIETHLGRHARFDRDAFPALNTSLMDDGALIIAAKKTSAAQPIHVLFVTAAAANGPVSAHPRCLVVAERGSECFLIEDYVSLSDGVYFNNPVTEIVVEDGARVRHIKLQRENRQAFHIANSAITLGRNAFYAGVSVAVGGRISRNDLQCLQTADGAECALDGLTLIGGRQLADTHTTIDHAQAHGSSRQLNKCIVDGGAHAVFNGKIMVREHAQQTDSAQSSRNLLLSDKARVDTKPQLEIFADDVKCAHGATVGQLDVDELFYLKSRGLNDATARSLLIYAFAAEIIERIPVASVKSRLQRLVMEQMHLEAIGGVQ